MKIKLPITNKPREVEATKIRCHWDCITMVLADGGILVIKPESCGQLWQPILTYEITKRRKQPNQ